MLALRERIIACEEEAELARFKALLAPTSMRRDYLRLEEHWLQLAATLRLATTVSQQLEWRSRRLSI